MEVLGGPPSSRDKTLEIPPVKASLWETYSESDDEYDKDFESVINFEYLITDYTNRKLSYASDALNAAAGVLNRSCQERDPIYNFAGLPYYRGSDDAASLIPIEQVIGHALSWHTEGKPSSRREGFPSWTWAGWHGQVRWEHPRPAPAPSRAYIGLRHIQLENQAGEILKLSDQCNTASGLDLQQKLNTVVAVRFEAPTFIATCIVQGDLGPSIGSQSLDLESWVPPDISRSFVNNVQQGLWSCFVILEQQEYGYPGLLVLVCRWKDEQTAERLGCFNLSTLDEEDLDSLAACLETRHVRLI